MANTTSCRPCEPHPGLPGSEFAGRPMELVRFPLALRQPMDYDIGVGVRNMWRGI